MLRSPGRATGREEPPGPERDVDQSDEDRHLDQGTDDTGEGLPGGDTEGGDGDGDRELEVVPGSGERERGGAGVAETEEAAGDHAGGERYGEVDEQRHRDP